MAGIVILSGCTTLTESLVQYGKTVEEANKNAPKKVCPKCGRVYEHDAIVEYCRTDGTRLVLSDNVRPAAETLAVAYQSEPEPPAAVSPQAKQDVYVVLVHGTTHMTAFLQFVLGDDSWCKEDDPGGFVPAFRAAFELAQPDAELHIQSFHWGGDDSNPDRNNGGVELSKLLDSFPEDSKVFVIAHSHGGNVALRALTFSERDAETVVLLGTPFFGVNMEVEQTGQRYTVPLYLPLPREAAKAHIVNIFSPQDSVATSLANLAPGMTATDLKYTNAEAWEKKWGLDRVKIRAPRNKKPGYRNKRVESEAVYNLDFGTAVIDQQVDESLGKDVTNISLQANTPVSLGVHVKTRWVHSQLHSSQVGAALGFALATDSFSNFVEAVGELHQ
jgi:hypothetical protein